MKENCSFNKYTDSGAVPSTQETLGTASEMHHCLSLCSEQMTINEYFLFAIGDSHQFARNSEIAFLLEKAGAERGFYSLH